LIATGFALLTLTLASGILFPSSCSQAGDLHAQEVFSVPAGSCSRFCCSAFWRYGWRGGWQSSWILAGTLLLVLGYLGSKFVLESCCIGNCRN